MKWPRGAAPGPAGLEEPGAAEPIQFDDAFLRRIERLSLRARRAVGPVGGRPGPRRTPAADFVDHRPYSPGDDRRHIDWHAAARHDEVFVKIGRAPQAASVHVVLDVSPSMWRWPAKRRLAAELTAALGWMALAHGDRLTVAGCAASDPHPTWGPASGAGRGPGLLAWLGALAPAPGVGSRLGPTVEGLVRAAPAGGLLVLVSDLWLADDLDATLRLAPPPRWETLLLQVLDRSELDPPHEGALALVDGETGAVVTVTVDDSVRAQYRQALNGRFERLRALATQRGAGHAVIPGDWPLEQAVLPYLQRRAVFA
jgi:uncharacterized protein (DUF58 family)